MRYAAIFTTTAIGFPALILLAALLDHFFWWSLLIYLPLWWLDRRASTLRAWRKPVSG